MVARPGNLTNFLNPYSVKSTRFCLTGKGSVNVDDLCKILSQPEYSDLRTSPEEVQDALRIFDKLGDGMVQVNTTVIHTCRIFVFNCYN